MNDYMFLYTIEYLHARPKLAGLLRFLNTLIPTITIASYSAMLIWILFFPFPMDRVDALKLLLIVPAIGFFGLTVVRAALNKPRPYDLYDFKPIINKKRPGKSFPSRHVFSAFMIAMVFISFGIRCSPYFLIVGIVFFVLADILGCIRMITGVHFAKDVIIGALIAIVLGIIMIFLKGL